MKKRRTKKFSPKVKAEKITTKSQKLSRQGSVGVAPESRVSIACTLRLIRRNSTLRLAWRVS